ncbi:helix-turn-helix domain-containing protein [Chryseobacterium kwangjuense]|uniref:HTH araC/xylS-type domain-containing protein n=1 Tax=Chryseobacterium kwangjuense TaxID=267125 RepID=A0A135WF35_9FLAO|nr:helix-turn-helix domain-containing protein [Chryseobacterium kwangjuense]KXH83511.1 hypothetical protein AU378_14050 [Chryseobacterium kwangjuense]
MRFFFYITILSITFIPIITYSQKNDEYWKKEIIKQREAFRNDFSKSIKIGLYIVNNCKNDSINAHSYALLSNSYTYSGDYINGFKFSNKAKELFYQKATDKRFVRYIVYNNISLSEIYKSIGLIERAKEEIENTIEYVEKKDPDNYYALASLYGSNGGNFYEAGDKHSALQAYLSAEKYAKKIDDPKLLIDKKKLLALIYSEIGNTYIFFDDLKKAEFYIEQSKKTSAEIKNYNYSDNYNSTGLAEIYTKTNRDKQAIDLLMSIYKGRNIEPVNLLFIHNLLSTAYKNIGDQKKSEIEKTKIDSIEYSMSKQESAGLKEAYKFIEADLARKDREHLMNKIIIFSVAAAIILIIIFWVIVYKRKLKKSYQELIASIERKEKEKENEKENAVTKSENTDTKKSKDLTSVEFSKSELELIAKLDLFEKEKGYLEKDMTLAVLAVRLETNASYLSQIINKAKNKNINTYINELRINYIIKEIYYNPMLLNYKVSHIAELAGFNSHNSFTLVFKRITNISPSTFLDERRKELSVVENN